MGELILPVALLAVLWFVMIRPQQKRRKEHQATINALAVGDDIVTIGGLHARVVGLTEGTMDLEVTADSDVVLRFERSAMGRVVVDDSGELTEPSDPIDPSSE